MTKVHHKIPSVVAANVATLMDSERLCLACLMLARGEQLAALKAETLRYAQDGRKGKNVWLSAEPAGDILEAVVIGISDMFPQLGRVPLCWDHLAGITLEESAPRLEVAPGPLPPAYRKDPRSR